VQSSAPNLTDAATIADRLAAREERIKLLEEENRWLKAQLFGRSSEKTQAEELNPDQGWLFNEAEALARAAEGTPQSITIPAHERGKGGRKKLSAALPRVEVIHDLPEDQKVCAADGTALERIGEEICEQLDFKPASVRVIRNIRPKYACPCCKSGVWIAPVPAQLLPKSLATPALLAHIITAKFVDGIPLYRQESQLARLGVRLPRATTGGWSIQLGGTHVVPVVNLLKEQLLEAPLIHCDETRLQVLKSDKAPTADHWMWVRAAGPPGRRIILFDYDPSRGGTVPMRLFEGYRGILLTDGYEPYESVAQALKLTHAGCMAHCPESGFIRSGCAIRAEIMLPSLRIAPDNNRCRIKGMRGRRPDRVWVTKAVPVPARAPTAARSVPRRCASSAGWLRRSGWL
jgi:transposase